MRILVKAGGKSDTGRLVGAAVRIGGSTYSREPFPKQVEELRESGFDYAELDLTWLTWEPTKLAAEAEDLAKRLPLFTAHLPPSHFHQADLARFVGFIDVLEPVGIHVFNAHFMEARSAPRISPETKASWFADLVRAASDRGAVVTVENVDEPPEVMRKVLDAVPDLQYCLDVGHAHLDNRTDGARTYMASLADRLGLVHAHDNHGGHGETGDEHLPFGKGTIDLERDARALKARGYEGPVTLEIFKGIPDDRPALRKRRTQLSADWVSLPSSEEARTFRASISRATSDATNAGRRRSSISRTRLLAAFDGALEGFHVHRTRHPPGPITRRTSSKHRLRPKRGWPKPEKPPQRPTALRMPPHLHCTFTDLSPAPALMVPRHEPPWAARFRRTASIWSRS